MNTKDITNSLLKLIDLTGDRLDTLGVTHRLNRHNLAAFVMQEQHHLEGEWDSLRVKVDMTRYGLNRQLDAYQGKFGGIADPVLNRVRPLVARIQL